MVLIFQMLKAFTGAEHQRDAPNTCQSNDRVDDSAEQRGLSAADPCHDVELEETDATPVQGTNDRQDQGESVNNHLNYLLETDASARH